MLRKVAKVVEPSAVPRTTPFGTRTYFATRSDSFFTALTLRVLRALKAEHDARSLGTLHFAFWTVLPRGRVAKLLRTLHTGSLAPARDQMLFLSDFSGDWEVYLVGFNKVLLKVLDLAWGRSIDWKPRMEIKDYLRFVRKYQITGQYYFQTYGERANVDDVRSAVYMSEQLDRFVNEIHDGDSERFESAYRRLRIRLGAMLAG